MSRGFLDFSSKTALAKGHNNGPRSHEVRGHKDGGVIMRVLLLGPVLFVCALAGGTSALAQQAAAPAPAPAATQQPVATATTTTSTTTTTTTPPAPAAQAPASIPTQTLPVTADQAPVEDPLSAFRQAQQQQQAPAQPVASGPVPLGAPASMTPPPTAGGFQEPTDPNAPPVDLNTVMTDAEIEAREMEMQQKAREQAFDASLNGMMPLSPDQIGALLDKYKVTREASEARIGGTPKPEVVVQTVSLDPGVTPPVIKLSPGHVTSVDILDITGQPWPVQDVSWGGNFEVISPGEGGHIIRVSPMGAMEVGNMSVQLVGLKTPVTFTLETQLEVVQYRFDARIPEYGPKASPPIIDPGLTIVAGSDKALGQILDGTPPAGTEKLRVGGVDGRTSVYRVGETMYLRTPLTLLSPGWSASVKSGDGMTVYMINNSPVLLLSDRGKMVRATVSEQKVAEQ